MLSRAAIHLSALAAAILLAALLAWSALADAPANEHFERVWARTDRPVTELMVNRTWMWGPEANTDALQEVYADTPGGLRTVQYFDKSRMEINDPDADPGSSWYVTNGLLVNELMTGAVQISASLYDEHPPAEIGVAGDPVPGNGPTYASLAPLRSSAPLPDGALVTQRVDADGALSDDAALAAYGVQVVYRVEVPGIDHQIAGPFWTFMNALAMIFEDGQLIEDKLFENPFFATGFPVIEPMWTTVQVAGVPTDVLVQCFERRCLTYTPSNAEGWRVETGNVGLHYYHWRYEQLPDITPPPDASPTAPVATSTPVATEPYVEVAAWGQSYDPSQQMERPAALDVGADNNVYVVDSAAHRVQVFDIAGVLQTSWGASGTAPGQFNAPSGVAVGAGGVVYVADRDNNRIQKFTGEGVPLDAWGTLGPDLGELDGPVGLAIDAAGAIYVADSRNHRIQRFSVDGASLDVWGDDTDGLGSLSLPLDVAIAEDGTIFVADSGNNRIALFDTGGSFISAWSSSELSTPSALALLTDGSVAVTDAANDVVLVFDESGTVVETWGDAEDMSASLELPLGIAADAAGRVFVADFGNARVQVYADGAWTENWDDGARGHLAAPEGVAFLAYSGITAVTDRELDKVVLFDGGGQFLREWSVVGLGGDRLDEPAGLAADASGRIYIVDSGHDRVVVFDQQGTLLDQWGQTGAAEGRFSRPSGIALDVSGNIYVTDTGNDRIQKFDDDGDFMLSWGTRGVAPGELVAPIGIAVWGGLVYVVDSGNERIQAFTLHGTEPVVWLMDGSDQGDLAQPTYLATDGDGAIYVSDTGNRRFQVFTSDGELVAIWGASAGDDTSGVEPRGLAPAADGALLVADATRQQIRVFVPSP